jgi:hypothetical protein
LPSPTASRTVRTLTVEEAAAAYLVVRKPYDRSDGQLVNRYSLTARCAWTETSGPCDRSEWDAAKAYWSGRAAALQTYVQGLRAIAFPRVAARLAAAYVDELVDAQRAAQAAARASSLASFNKLVPGAVAALGDAHDYDPWELLMDALGLPVGP